MPVDFDSGLTLADRMRRHAGDDSHLYAHLMRAMATDWEDGGPVRAICAGWDDAPSGSVVQLRVLAGLFRIVLQERAPELEPFYPCLGGTADPGGAWPAVRRVLAANVDELARALTIAPQTNEVGRSNALLAGIFPAVAGTGRRKVRLLEPGASAGLNLLVDAFRFTNQGWAYGPVGSPVVLADGIDGAVWPEPFEIVDRRGCDLSPVDVATTEGRLRLRSFVWPFQVERHERLSAALEVAAAMRPVVDRAPAGEWLERSLSRNVDDDVLTVVWQSVTRLYWPPEETARVTAAIAEAASRTAVAHVCMEYDDVERRPVLSVAWSSRPGSQLQAERLGTVGDHGFPVRLSA
ncbi:MAG: DUF2332 domain-containing protein [Nocardioidaceae bacterium]